jgi:hypothetical protein
MKEVKVTDLRMGNLVMEHGEIVKVGFRTFAHFDKMKTLMEDTIKPIPLTKEWDNEIKMNHFEGQYFKRTRLGRVILFDRSGAGVLMFKHNDWTRYIEYVHQFQNFWKELTTEEINIDKTNSKQLEL